MHVESHAIAEELRKLGDLERRVVTHFIHRQSVVQDTNAIFDHRLTLSQRVADRVAAFAAVGRSSFCSLGS